MILTLWTQFVFLIFNQPIGKECYLLCDHFNQLWNQQFFKVIPLFGKKRGLCSNLTCHTNLSLWKSLFFEIMSKNEFQKFTKVAKNEYLHKFYANLILSGFFDSYLRV